MKEEIKIEIKGAEESAQEFVDAWHRAQRDESPKEPVNRVYFQDLSALLRALTPRRLELLKVMHEKGVISIRALAGMLKRDYKNVHEDVSALEVIGLIERTGKGFSVPWERILAEIKLAA
jgi:predicted transcriptional regulator